MPGQFGRGFSGHNFSRSTHLSPNLLGNKVEKAVDAIRRDNFILINGRLLAVKPLKSRLF